jgi:dihydroorotate dehydrogenase electron transfer subunit
LWLSEALRPAGKNVVFFFGARTRELIPLQVDEAAAPDSQGRRATLSLKEISRSGAASIICTDDGSLGMQGHVVAGLQAYHEANPIDPADLVVYTCGPERMMRAVAQYFVARKIDCQVCMERPMACGTGTCQSCIVAVKSDHSSRGFRYALCCTEGPVFDARDVLWDA